MLKFINNGKLSIPSPFKTLRVRVLSVSKQFIKSIKLYVKLCSNLLSPPKGKRDNFVRGGQVWGNFKKIYKNIP